MPHAPDVTLSTARPRALRGESLRRADGKILRRTLDDEQDDGHAPGRSSARGRRLSIAFGVIVACILAGPHVRADEAGPLPTEPADEPTLPPDSDSEARAKTEDDAFKPIRWGPKGLDIRSQDGSYHAHIDWRAQLRFTESTFGGEGLAPNPETRESQFGINRARFKVGGHAYRPWLIYYLEVDLVTPALLDLRFALKPADAFQFRFGQGKFPYNRERVDSSGKQQFAERSVVTPYFTIDRQQGLTLFGRLWEGRLADSWYNVGVNAATGRGGRGHVERPMVLGRWQWNFLKRDLAFSQSDYGYRKKTAASVAVAGATWQGPYTAFSSKGGGELDGFPVGDEDAYKVEQAMVETALQGHGFSFQQEHHWKKVEDTVNRTVTRLEGGHLQVSYFFHARMDWVPQPLELTARIARVDPDVVKGNDLIRQATFAANWFFAGHRNKLTLDLSFLDREAADPDERQETRVRIQWEVSF